MQVPRSVTIILVCAGFMLGLIARHFLTSSWQLAICASVFITIVTAIFTRQILLAIILGAVIILGFWRCDLQQQGLSKIQSLYGSKVVVAGTIADDPAVNQRGFLLFSLDVNSINNRPTSGNLTVRTYNQKLRRGYQIFATSKIDSTLGNKVGQLTYATITIKSSHLSTLEQWRQRYFAGMRNALPEPSASFALGLLLGTRGLIPKEVQDMLQVVGLTHLIAVSGYNLTILINAARQPLRRVSKFMALMAPIWLIFVFMLLTGFSASIVRAAIVSVLSLLAAYYGRAYKPMVLIMISAVITLLYNPAYLWSDVGWQLSYLAFCGILILAPLLEKQFRAQSTISKLIIESMSAYIVTMPLIMALFGNLSIIAPVANLLILPLVPLVMLLAFIAGIFGMSTPLAPVLGLPLKILLALMLGTMNMLASVPMASLKIPANSIAFALYIPIILSIVILHIQTARRSFVIR